MSSNTGLIHIYEGDGKGKTTAAVGLAVRFAGNGKTVVFTQFLKSNNSSELKILEEIGKIRLIRCDKSFGFTFQMTPEEKQEAAEYYTAHLHKVLVQVKKLSEECQSSEDREKFLQKEEEKNEQKKEVENADYPAVLLVLDEIMAAYNQHMINRQELLTFLKEKPDKLEVVLTGRNPAPELLELADYVTFMEKRKHPYEQGISARPGIEW